MPAHSGMRARRRRRRRRRRPVPGRAQVWVRVRVPYPAWFEPPANGCLKTVWTVGRLDRCAVGRLDRTVATVRSEPLQLLDIRGR